MKWQNTQPNFDRHVQRAGVRGYFRLALVATSCVLCANYGCSIDVHAAPTTPARTERRTFPDINRELARGQALLDNNDPGAEAALRPLAEGALDSLNSFAGSDVLKAPDVAPHSNGALATATRQTARAHYLWGVAADRAAQRDVAITALSRALRLAGNQQNGPDELARETLFILSGILREGLPLVAADDVLDTIAARAHGGLWKPLRFTFQLPPSVLGPASNEAQAQGGLTWELLITSGRMFPPLDTSPAATNVSQVFTSSGGLARIPPMYQAVAPDALPKVLKLDKMVVGYTRGTGGTNRGLWRQVVRVYYPSTFLTKDERDDRPRAEALCLQFLKVHALFQAALGLGNPYTNDGVTSIWLSEVSALWPKDDEDPAIRSALGLLMPVPNTSTSGDEKEIDTSPLTRPWTAAGQVDSAPGEIMFFKVGEARDESEWLRELLHEYGHVSLPAIGGFRPPLEPYGNGEIGEALGMLWAAGSASDQWQPPLSNTAAPVTTTISATGSTEAMQAGIRSHVEESALRALRHWNTQGPSSLHMRDAGPQGLSYLTGLAVYMDRVYGGPILGAASRPLVALSSGAPNSQARAAALRTNSLLASIPTALRDPFGAGNKVLPVWLPGAFDAPSLKISPDELSRRAPIQLRARERAAAWLYVPATANALTVTYGASRSGQNVALKIEGTWKATSTAPSERGGTLRIQTEGRSGWQRLVFVPSDDVTITGSWFERGGAK